MNNPTGQIPEQGEGDDPSEVADTRTIEQKLEDWAHDLAHSRVFNGAAPVCREAAALIADLRQTCADQGAAYHALAERLAERSNRDFVACTAAGAEGVRMGVALAEATSEPAPPTPTEQGEGGAS